MSLRLTRDRRFSSAPSGGDRFGAAARGELYLGADPAAADLGPPARVLIGRMAPGSTAHCFGLGCAGDAKLHSAAAVAGLQSIGT